MNDIKEISSLKNPLVKNVIQLKEKSRERTKQGLFIIEGQRELQLAIKGNYSVKTVLYCDELIAISKIQHLISNKTTDIQFIRVSLEVYKKLAYRVTTEGVMAIVVSKEHKLDSLILKQEVPLILVAQAPEKPGNIGALLRTADAANLSAVLIADPRGDLYNPNIIRSSVGCVFTQKIAMASTTDIIKFLKEKNIAINCAALSASKNYLEIDYTQKTAIVVGTEATGLSEEWIENSTQNIIIPMRGEIDSMNVSVSAAILIFEAIRQRSLLTNC